MDSQPGVLRCDVVRRLPVVGTPMKTRPGQQFHAQRLPRRETVNFVIKSPHRIRRPGLFFDITLNRLERPIKNAALLQ